MVANHGNINSPIINNEKVELQLGLVTVVLRYFNLHQKRIMVKNGEKYEIKKRILAGLIEGIDRIISHRNLAVK